MAAKPEAARILVLAEPPALRRWIHAALGNAFFLQHITREDLRVPARLVDACGAVAVLHGEDAAATLVALEALAGMPAGRALVLVTGDVPEPLLERAIDALDPHGVLPHPAPHAALSLAVRRAVPDARPGTGARANHRPARALLGVSAAIRKVMDQVRRFGPASMPVLITGETGTGKELVARALHETGPRASRPFVAVNCGALPDGLLESELFGFERGAFTGAERTKRGLFEVADGGTLFLDEIGDTSPALQVKLLRALEEGEIRPLGSTSARRVAPRIVSATHRDVEALVEQGAFREDLLYRLNTATIYVPPLRRRPVDIPFLAQHFAEEFGAAHARRVTLSEDLLEALTRRSFRGNVRELRNAVERAIALAQPDDEELGREHLGPAATSPLAPEPPYGTLRDRVEQLERQAIRETLARCDGNRTHAARELGLSRVGLRQKLRRLGLERAPGR